MKPLLELVAELRHLTESVQVGLDMKKVIELMHDELDDLVDYSARKRSEDDPLRYTHALAEKDKVNYERELQKAMEQHVFAIKRAVGNIPGWRGSKLLIRANPARGWDGKPSFRGSEGDVTDTADVSVYQASPRNAPGFTRFADGTIDDVLEAGDTDFFHHPDLEADYFALVNELRHPGKAKTEGEKTVTLYTARPLKDRHLYDKATHVPANIFLTTSADEAEGYAVDFGGDRDIWRMQIKKKYLVLTLDRPHLKNYQAFAPGGKVPVEKIQLL